MGLLHHPFWLSACLDTFGITLSNFWNYFVWLRITDEGSLPEMRVWSILLINPNENGVYILVETFLIFQPLGECHCRWTIEAPRAHVAKFYGRLPLIRSVLRASKFSVFKLIIFASQGPIRFPPLPLCGFS